MNADLGSIVFLAFFILVPLGMVAGIIYLIVRKARGRSAAGSVARDLGWEETDSAASGLRTLLEPTLFAMRSGRHDLRSVSSGEVGGMRCWIAEYHYRAPGAQRETRRGGVYSLLVMELDSGPKDLMVQHRQSGALASLAEKAAGARVMPATLAGWEWAIVSSNDDLRALAGGVAFGEALKNATIPGDTLFFLDHLTVWSRSDSITSKWAGLVPEMIELLQRYR